MLDDQDPLVGESALRALLARNDDQILQVRERHLTRSSGPTTELARVRLAVRSGDESALRKLMRNGGALTQESAFEALASTDTDAAVDLLKREFQDSASLYRLQTLGGRKRGPTSAPTR